MFARIIANNLPWACNQILGSVKGPKAYPYIKAVIDLFMSGSISSIKTLEDLANTLTGAGFNIPTL